MMEIRGLRLSLKSGTRSLLYFDDASSCNSHETRERTAMTARITVPESLPTTAVVRVSRASYDPNRFTEVDAASKKTSVYIIPAIRRLPGLIHFYAGVSPKGSIVQVS